MTTKQEKQALIDADNARMGRVLLVIAKVAAVLAVIGAIALTVRWFQEREQNRLFGVNIVGINHTDYGIDFYVNGYMGGGIAAHSGGNKSACCLDIPAHYKQGLTVRVVWQSTLEPVGSDVYQTRDVPVPPYDANQVAQFSVHFLRSGEIKVLAATTGRRDPDYPIKDPL